jgi:PAS domain S-box-containing protein
MNFEPNIPTLVIILGLTHLLQVIVFFQQFRINKSNRGIGWWLMWSIAEALGFGAVLLQYSPSLFYIAIIIQYSLIIAGTFFIYFGVRRFYNLELNLRLMIPLGLIFLAVLLFFLFVDDNIQVRLELLSFTIIIISLFTAYSLFVYKTKHTASSANFLIGVFIVHSAIFLYHFGMTIAYPNDDQFFTPTFINILPLFDAMIVSLAWTFGFIILINQRLNREMLEAKENLQLIFNTSPDAAIITQLNDGKIVNFNDGYLTITKFSPEDLNGKSTFDINIWQNIDDRHLIIKQILHQGYCDNYEVEFIRKDGEAFTGLMSARLIYLQDVPHIISITRDITERKLNELEIKLKNEELLKLNAEKDKFFSIIAHDLRGPMSGFLGLTQTIAEELPSLTMTEIQEIAVIMRKSATNLYRLLETLLDWARIKQKLIVLNKTRLKLRLILEESVK